MRDFILQIYWLLEAPWWGKTHCLSVSFSWQHTLVYFKILLLQHHVDPAIGVYIIDRYTYYALEFLENVTPESNQSMGEFVSLNSSSSHNKTVNKFNFS